MYRECYAIPGGEDRIYVKRDWLGTVGQELWSNKGERKANGRPSDSQINYVHKMGLINREMASRECQNLLGQSLK